MNFISYFFPKQDSQSNNCGSKKGASMKDRPELGRKACNFSGIKNQGATCYLNTLIQTLFLTPEFRGFTLKLKRLLRYLNALIFSLRELI